MVMGSPRLSFSFCCDRISLLAMDNVFIYLARLIRFKLGGVLGNIEATGVSGTDNCSFLEIRIFV